MAENEKIIEQRCCELLKARGMTFAAAESCTGGLIAKRITDVPGASLIFMGGVVSYTDTVKHRVLGVPAEMLEEYGAVSAPVARAMAEGARRATTADLAVSTGCAIMHVGPEQLPATLTSLAGVLRPGGTLSFETRNPAAKAWESWAGSSVEVPYQGTTVKVRYEVHEIEGELVRFSEITDGGRWHDQVDRGTLRFLPRIELDRFLAEAGLRAETYYGDWERGPLTEDSPEIVAVARRSAA